MRKCGTGARLPTMHDGVILPASWARIPEGMNCGCHVFRLWLAFWGRATRRNTFCSHCGDDVGPYTAARVPVTRAQ